MIGLTSSNCSTETFTNTFGLVEFVELGSCGEVLCEDLSLDCLGPRTPSVLTAKLASDVSFDPGSLGMFLVAGLEPSTGFGNPKQLRCGTFENLEPL